MEIGDKVRVRQPYLGSDGSMEVTLVGKKLAGFIGMMWTCMLPDGTTAQVADGCLCPIESLELCKCQIDTLIALGCQCGGQ